MPARSDGYREHSADGPTLMLKLAEGQNLSVYTGTFIEQ